MSTFDRTMPKTLAILSTVALALSLFSITEPEKALASTACSPTYVTTTETAGVLDPGGTRYAYLTFSAIGACSYTIPDGAANILAVIFGGGGGGGGGASTTAGRGGGGGGGAGEALYFKSIPSAGTLSISVGQGGTAGLGGADVPSVAAATSGGTGGETTISSGGTTLYTARGGGGGGAGGSLGGAGGSSWGSSGGVQAVRAGLVPTSGTQGAGGSSSPGTPLESSLTGPLLIGGGVNMAFPPPTFVNYVRGGPGARSDSMVDAATTPGSGGRAGRGSQATSSLNYGYDGSVGQNGLVIIRYELTNVAVSSPTITSVSPSTGASSGGTSITIEGTGFLSTAGQTVTIGGAPCVITGRTLTSITCTTPAGVLGTADIVVNNEDGGTTTSLGGFTYSDSPDPSPPDSDPRPSEPTSSSHYFVVEGFPKFKASLSRSMKKFIGQEIGKTGTTQRKVVCTGTVRGSKWTAKREALAFARASAGCDHVKTLLPSVETELKKRLISKKKQNSLTVRIRVFY